MLFALASKATFATESRPLILYSTKAQSVIRTRTQNSLEKSPRPDDLPETSFDLDPKVTLLRGLP